MTKPTYSELEAENLRVRGLLQRQWISVEERLPEHTDYVLVYLPENDGDLDSKITACAWYDGCWNGPLEEYNPEMVTHWMPVPEPPPSSAPQEICMWCGYRDGHNKACVGVRATGKEGKP